ncbi:MAG: DUF2183 domain-containing protein, partial [Anaerolineae bacterium]|nr:DUF2183 domain-containing protein [Anaerolineae bacterium]
MSLWQRLRHLVHQLEQWWDRLWQRWRQTSLQQTPVTIVPYIGHGTHHLLRIRGRVLQNRHIPPATASDSIWRNLRNIYRRFITAEIPYAEVTVQFDDQQEKVQADDEGYFLVELHLEKPLPPDAYWLNVELTYDDGQRTTQVTGSAVVPSQNAEYGIVSDLDDTVLRSEVINWFKLARNTFLRNAHTRLPFHGVAEFYQALQDGVTPGIHNPIYYVSNSPYNLYDMIEEFFRLREIPLGPIFLRDFGVGSDYFVASRRHKKNRIEDLLALHPDLPFILIGDSGEYDASIYLEIIKEYPGRIIAVYIRDVEPNRPDTTRDQRVKLLAKEAEKAGCEMLLIGDTLAAAKHAVEHGFILPSKLDDIAAAVEADQP